MQCAHFVASIGISLIQYGHFFVVGAGAGAASSLGMTISLNLLIVLTIRKITNAIIKKSITVVIN